MTLESFWTSASSCARRCPWFAGMSDVGIVPFIALSTVFSVALSSDFFSISSTCLFGGDALRTLCNQDFLSGHEIGKFDSDSWTPIVDFLLDRTLTTYTLLDRPRRTRKSAQSGLVTIRLLDSSYASIYGLVDGWDRCGDLCTTLLQSIDHVLTSVDRLDRKSSSFASLVQVYDDS